MIFNNRKWFLLSVVVVLILVLLFVVLIGVNIAESQNAPTPPPITTTHFVQSMCRGKFDALVYWKPDDKTYLFSDADTGEVFGESDKGFFVVRNKSKVFKDFTNVRITEKDPS